MNLFLDKYILSLPMKMLLLYSLSHQAFTFTLVSPVIDEQQSQYDTQLEPVNVWAFFVTVFIITLHEVMKFHHKVKIWP